MFITMKNRQRKMIERLQQRHDYPSLKNDSEIKALEAALEIFLETLNEYKHELDDDIWEKVNTEIYDVFNKKKAEVHINTLLNKSLTEIFKFAALQEKKPESGELVDYARVAYQKNIDNLDD